MAQVVRFLCPGGPEVLHLAEVPTGEPGFGEVLVRHAAIGINFADALLRRATTGRAVAGRLGEEAAGIVVAVGEGVAGVQVGDRVAYASSGAPGSYCDERVVPASALIALPPEIAFDTAAAVTRRGLTAGMLLRRAWRLAPGDTILVHAAAGGVGLLLVQWAKLLDLRVIGTTSSLPKARLARAFGADHALLYRHEDVPARVNELTCGRGVRVVFDGVGRDTFAASLASLAPRGALVLFGNTSGDVLPVAPSVLAERSLFMTCPTLGDYIGDPAHRAELASELFTHVAEGRIRVEINQRYWISEASRAHRDLESGFNTGSSIFVT